MKRILIFSAAFLLVVTAIAKEKIFSLEELLQQSDLIVVARLEGSSLKSERLPDSKTFHSWKGQLKVSSVIRGPAKKGENLKLEWMTNMNPICIRPIDHRGRAVVGRRYCSLTGRDGGAGRRPFVRGGGAGARADRATVDGRARVAVAGS